MLAKKYRLTWRDIQYMLRRGSKTRGTYFWCMTVAQYPNASYHQRSVQISVKVDKRAVMRNELKRIAREVFQELLDAHTNTSKRQLKRFLFINKKSVDQRAQKLVESPKLDRKALWKSYCIKDFKLILSKCLSSQWLTQRSRPWKVGGQVSQRSRMPSNGKRQRPRPTP